MASPGRADRVRDDRLRERFSLQGAARELLPDERVAECLRAIVPGLDNVKVMHSPSVMRAHFKHLLVCASVWSCPVCAAKISERRRVELTQAIDKHPELVPVLVTLTIEHSRSHSLKESRSALLNAYKRLTKGKSWDKFKARFKVAGTIRALEVTHGVNGWHPHIHTLAFLERGKIDEGAFAEFISARWRSMVGKEERFANEHGCEVTFRRKAIGSYVTKFGEQSQWTVEHELTKAVSKISRSARGLSPFGLLRQYHEGDKASGRLFVEYARAMKGQRQLVWSKGLRDRLGLTQEKTDEEIAKESERDAVLLLFLSRLQWKRVLANDARAELLAVAGCGDAEIVWEWLRGIGIDRFETGARVRRALLPAEVIGAPPGVMIGAARRGSP